jgi:hypothetical protein
LQLGERFGQLEARLPRILRGQDQPTSAGECLDLAELCVQKKWPAAAARLWARAFAIAGRLADDLQAGHRYNAACSAALAAAGQGLDAGQLPPGQRLALRRQALTWLRADLRAHQKQCKSGGPAEAARARAALRHWQNDPDLACLRDKDAVAKLPAEERATCEKLWADVAALLKKAQTPARKEGKE